MPYHYKIPNESSFQIPPHHHPNNREISKKIDIPEKQSTLLIITSVRISTSKKKYNQNWNEFCSTTRSNSKRVNNFRTTGMKNHSNNRCRHFIGLWTVTRRKTHRWVSEKQAVGCSWVSERQESRVRAVLICRVYYSVDVAPDTSAPCSDLCRPRSFQVQAFPTFLCSTYAFSAQKYTSLVVEFSRKEGLVCVRGFVEIFPPTAFLVSTSCGQTRETGWGGNRKRG